VLTGRTIADLVRNLFVVIVMLVVGLIVGFRPSGNPLAWLAAIALILLVSFAFSWISAVVGLLVHSAEAAQSAGFVWLFPLTFASSAFVQVATMPTWLQGFAGHQPVTIFVDVARALLLGQSVGAEGWQAIAWCLGILVVFIPVSVWTYGRRVGR
jgi:ABC-2 type transport system permease protein/oleandomycin transport system permease protein